MGKTIKKNDPFTKKYSKKKHRKNTKENTNIRHSEIPNRHEEGHFPRKIWPTDSEKHKGPKV